jgi:hypothetical protein
MQRSLVELIPPTLKAEADLKEYSDLRDHLIRLNNPKPMTRKATPMKMKALLPLKPIAINAIPRAMNG